MRASTLEVAMLAEVSGAAPKVRFPVLTYVWLGPSDISLRDSLWMYFTLIGQQNVSGAALESWRFVMDYE